MKDRKTSLLRKSLLFMWLGLVTPITVISFVVMRFMPDTIKKRRAHSMARLWARGMLFTTGAQCTVEGLEYITHSGPFVVMSSHRSHMDVPVAITYLPFLFGFIVKKELMSVPVFRSAMQTIGCVAVSRGQSRGDHSVLDAVAADVAAGKNILIFPEGTRAPDDEFLPFKKGGVVTAIKAGVPILPVAISGTNHIIPARIHTVSSGPVLMRIGAPIITKELTLEDRDALLAQVQSAIADLYVPNYVATTKVPNAS